MRRYQAIEQLIPALNPTPTTSSSNVGDDGHFTRSRGLTSTHSFAPNTAPVRDEASSHHDSIVDSVHKPAELAIAFASAVTVNTGHGSDWIAKNGGHSVFSVFNRIVPQVCREDGSLRRPMKGKIAQAEFNKVLQNSCGFVCQRSRKSSLASKNAGFWLFAGRRWLNPSDPKDTRRLEGAYNDLCSTHPIFAQCGKAEFFKVLSEVCEAWSQIHSDDSRYYKSLAEHAPSPGLSAEALKSVRERHLSAHERSDRQCVESKPQTSSSHCPTVTSMKCPENPTSLWPSLPTQSRGTNALGRRPASQLDEEQIETASHHPAIKRSKVDFSRSGTHRHRQQYARDDSIDADVAMEAPAFAHSSSSATTGAASVRDGWRGSPDIAGKQLRRSRASRAPEGDQTINAGQSVDEALGNLAFVLPEDVDTFTKTQST